MLGWEEERNKCWGLCPSSDVSFDFWMDEFRFRWKRGINRKEMREARLKKLTVSNKSCKLRKERKTLFHLTQLGSTLGFLVTIYYTTLM